MGTKGVFDKYECSGQMELFDFMETHNKRFCWDEDINEIVQQIRGIAAAYGLELGKLEFNVWSHVPNLGYRLSVDIKGTRMELSQDAFQNDVNNLVEFAEGRNVELSAMWGALMFFSKKENEKGSLHLTTMFMDKQRQRRK